MKLISRFLVAVSLSILGLTASAQTETTPNLVTNIRAGSGTGVWLGTGGNSQLNGVHPITLWGCCTSYSGSNPFFDTSQTNGNGQSGQIIWSYGNVAVNHIVAINQALSGSGVQINGYNWSYDVRNNNGGSGQAGVDTLTATSRLWNSTYTNVLLQQSRTHNTTMDWTTFSSTVTAPTPYALSNVGNLALEFRASDSGFWGGYYGPQIRNVQASFNYSVAPVDPCVSDPQSSPACPGYKTYYNDMWDDGYAQVDLPFTFPMYGQNFTTSYMFTNGVVGFLNPTNSFCCSGVDLNSNPGSPWNYAIYGVQTDLGPGYDSRFWSQVGDGGTSMRYGWDNVYELGSDNKSTFNIQIKNTGYIGINYQSVNVQNNNITAGIAGDISQGQYSQIFSGWGGAFTPNAQYTFTGTEITDQCASNPLWSTTCPGYQQAYFNQQCSYNPLYNSQCPGYQQAYFTQQCNMNALYDTACPGYATAYYNYQCSANALYHTGCPNYTTAYFNQQCGLSPLYNNQCPGYAQAYFDQQCSSDPLYNNQCPGYADAFYVQQCNISPLYDSGCTGYETAYFNQQCSLNTLYNSACPGYETAYFDQQCALDALYNNQCPGYSEAYALKYVVVSTPAAETTVIAEPVVVAQVTVTETKEAAVATAVTEPAAAPTVSASPAAAATAPVSLVSAPATTTSTAAAPAEKKAEAKTEAKTETAAAGGGASESKNKPATTRQALAQRRLEAAREAAAESAKANPSGVASQMDSAASMEQQAELQNVVLGAMGFVAGFDAYGRVALQDAAGYKPFEIYKGQKNVDSAAARGLLGRSDRIHQDMVDSQYNK